MSKMRTTNSNGQAGYYAGKFSLYALCSTLTNMVQLEFHFSNYHYFYRVHISLNRYNFNSFLISLIKFLRIIGINIPGRSKNFHIGTLNNKQHNGSYAGFFYTN